MNAQPPKAAESFLHDAHGLRERRLQVRWCRKIISTGLPSVRAFSPRWMEGQFRAFIAGLADGFVHRRSGNRLPRAENPNAISQAHLRRSSNWAENNLTVGTLDFQGITGLELEFISDGLGQD